MYEKEWAEAKDIPGFEGFYRLASDGTAYSIRKNKVTIKKLKQGIRNRYPYLELYGCGQKYVRFSTHILVYTLYVGPLEAGKWVDHINGIQIDNRVSNLRAATVRQNNVNRIKRRSVPNPYKGITYVKVRDKWKTCSSGLGDERKYKSYPTALAAAIMYDLYALKYFGEFARTNFIKIADQLEHCPCVCN